jgi:hypothetical protein
VEIGERVLERLATSDKTTIVIEKQPNGKMRVTSNSWGDEAKVFMRDQGARAQAAEAIDPFRTSRASS